MLRTAINANSKKLAERWERTQAQRRQRRQQQIEQEAAAETTFTPSLNQRRRDWRPSSAPSGGRHSRLNVSTDMDRSHAAKMVATSPPRKRRSSSVNRHSRESVQQREAAALAALRASQPKRAVSRTIIAGIWVEFFQACQQQVCGQVGRVVGGKPPGLSSQRFV